MTASGWIQIIIYLVVLLALVKPLGGYMARVYQGERTFLDPVLGPVERLIYRLAGVRPDEEMDWKTYALAMLLFSLVGFVFLYLLQRVQAGLPLNPQGMGAVSPDLAFNTAVSFATNTNWQGYGGETTMSYLTQMLGLTVQNFVSAAAGMAVLVAFIRGLRPPQRADAGQFLGRPDPQHAVHPAAAVDRAGAGPGFAGGGADLCALSDGSTASARPGCERATRSREQVLAVGPAASQIAIKQLGTNGGGFFNVNSAHPFENPTPFSNFLEMLSILLIPAALCYTFGKMVGDTRQGWALLAAMTIVLVVFCGVAVCGRSRAATRAWRRWGSIRPPAICSRAATWRAKKCALAWPTPPSGPPPPPPPPTARSTPCTTRSRRWAGWCRW